MTVQILPVSKRSQLAIGIATWIVPAVVFYAFLLTFVSSFTIYNGVENINDAVAEGSTGNKVFWILLFCAAIFVWLELYKDRVKELNWQVYLLIAYTLMEVLSAFWSEVPLISLRRSIQQVIVIFCVLTPFLLGIDREQILFRVCAVLGFIMIVNALFIPVLGIPDFGYKGVFPQKNLLGQVSVMACFFSIYTATRTLNKQRLIFVGIAVLSILLIVISRSKTSLALLLVVPILSYSLVSWVRAHDFLLRWVLMLMVVLMICVFISASITIPFDVYDISNVLFHDSTFTGRTVIWKFAGHYINQAPWLGYGYGSFWGVGSATNAIGEGFIGALLQAHDGYVDIVLDLGYVGLSVAIIFIFALVNSILALVKFDLNIALLMLSIFLFVLLDNTMESSLFRSYVPLWVAVLLCSGLSSKKIR